MRDLVAASVNVTLSNLTIRNGFSTVGGGVFNSGALRLNTPPAAVSHRVDTRITLAHSNTWRERKKRGTEERRTMDAAPEQ
jgi:hypothetical protein